jgi:hypothetical protein
MKCSDDFHEEVIDVEGGQCQVGMPVLVAICTSTTATTTILVRTGTTIVYLELFSCSMRSVFVHNDTTRLLSFLSFAVLRSLYELVEKCWLRFLATS